MKRLLAYLFMVLGLGLTVNVNIAKAKGFNLFYTHLHPEKIFVSKCRGTGEGCPINTKTQKYIYKDVKKNLWVNSGLQESEVKDGLVLNGYKNSLPGGKLKNRRKYVSVLFSYKGMIFQQKCPHFFKRKSVINFLFESIFINLL